jgi:soluble lytic murein transglycosylase-like protein
VGRKILVVLSIFGLQAGFAAGPRQIPVPLGPAVPPAASSELALAPAPAPPPPVPSPAASPAAALVPAERLYLEPILARAAEDNGVPRDIVLAQAWAESSWRVDAVSAVGATGVLQLTASTVEFVSKRLLKLDHELDVLDPTANARMGARYMKHLLDRTDGDVRQALIAYNQGLSGLRRNGPYPAAETYADRVLALRPLFSGGA